MSKEEKYFKTHLLVYSEKLKALNKLKNEFKDMENIDIDAIDAHIKSCEDWINHYKELVEKVTSDNT